MACSPPCCCYDDWLSFKVWGVTAVIFVFTMAQTPLLTKHGLKLD